MGGVEGGGVMGLPDKTKACLWQSQRQLRGKQEAIPSAIKEVFRNFTLAPAQSLRFKADLARRSGMSGRSSGVEHNLAKVRVGRSNRLARSNFFL